MNRIASEVIRAACETAYFSDDKVSFSKLNTALSMQMAGDPDNAALLYAEVMKTWAVGENTPLD